MPPALLIENLRFAYRAARPQDAFTLRIDRLEVAAAARSGGGKSTLFSIIAGRTFTPHAG